MATAQLLAPHSRAKTKQVLLGTLCANPGDALQDIEAKNEDLQKLLKKFPWPELKYFWASGRTYSLPLRAESSKLLHRPAKARLEYLAGFFDGDGCVGCQSNMSGCQLSVSQSFDQAEVLMLFREAFDGSISREKGGKGLRKPALRWQVYGDSARRAAQLLAPHSITKPKQLLIAARWPKRNSRREDCKAELRELKEDDSSVPGSRSWEYWAGFFDAEGCIALSPEGASLQLRVAQKHPRVLQHLRGFLSTTSGTHATLVNYTGHGYALCIGGTSNCKQILQCQMEVGLLCKARQAELVLELTPENAADVRTELAGLKGNQNFGKRLDAAGQERSKKIHSDQQRAARLRQRGLHTEAKQCNITKLKQDHDLLNAHCKNRRLLEYIWMLQSLHENSWEGPLAPGM